MKNILFIICTLIGIPFYAQIGINTTSPKATLDIEALPKDMKAVDGLIAARLTGNQLNDRKSKYNVAQEGVIVYVTKPADNPSDKTINVDKEGYYYFDGKVWINFINNGNVIDTSDNNINIYNSNGTLTEDRVVNLNGKMLNFNSNSQSNNWFDIKGPTSTTAITMNLRTNRMAINNTVDKNAVLSVVGKLGDNILKLTNINNSIEASKYANTTSGYFDDKKVTSLVVDESGDVIRQYTPIQSADFPNSYTVNQKFSKEEAILVFDDLTDASLCYFKVMLIPNDSSSYNYGVAYGEVTFTVKDGFKIINQAASDGLSYPQSGVSLMNGTIYRLLLAVNNVTGTLDYENGTIKYRSVNGTKHAVYVYEAFKI